jgi:Family of unknown function (DUF5677)
MMNSSEYLNALHKRTEQLSAEFSRRHADSDFVIQQAFDHLVWSITHVQIRPHRRQIAAAALTSRILQQTHAAYLLLRDGHSPSAAVILRSILESVFAVVALARDVNFEEGRDFFLRLRYKTKHADAQGIKKFLSTANSLTEERRKVLTEKQSDDGKWMTEHKQHAMTTVREVALAADMLDCYAREYAWQSKPTHSDIDEVVNAHVTEENGTIKFVAAVVAHAQAPELAAQIATILMDTASALTHMFGLELPPEEAQRQLDVALLVDGLYQRAAAPNAAI